MTISLVFGKATLNDRATHLEQACNDLCEEIEKKGYEVAGLQVLASSSPTGENEGSFSHSPEVVEEGYVLVATYRKAEAKMTMAGLQKALKKEGAPSG